MTHEEIMKALEICSSEDYRCAECPLFCRAECINILRKESLNLIKFQQARISRLQYVIKLMQEENEHEQN